MNINDINKLENECNKALKEDKEFFYYKDQMYLTSAAPDYIEYLKKNCDMTDNYAIARPETQAIIVSIDISDEEIQRNLDKKDAEYLVIDDEYQYIMDFSGKRKCRKVTLWSAKKNKIKFFTFI